MNFTQDELAELQKINNVTDQELGTRTATPAEFAVFESTLHELWEQHGFAVSKDNFLKLWLAFDGAATQVPITRDTILRTTELFRDKFQWKSDEEIDYGKLSGQLGKQKSDLLWGYMDGHRLEAVYSNFNSCARFYLAKGYGLESREQFTRLLGNLQNSRQGSYGAALTWKLTPDEVRRAKESEKVSTPTTRTPEEIAAEREAAVSHIPQGFEQGRYKKYTPTPTNHPAPSDEGQTSSERHSIYWNGRITSLVNSIQSNVLRAEVEQFANRISMPDIEKKYQAVEHYWNRRKTERAMAGRMG